MRRAPVPVDDHRIGNLDGAEVAPHLGLIDQLHVMDHCVTVDNHCEVNVEKWDAVRQ